MAKLGVRQIQAEAISYLRSVGGRTRTGDIVDFIAAKSPETKRSTITTQVSELPRTNPELVQRREHGYLELIFREQPIGFFDDELGGEGDTSDSFTVAWKADPRIYSFVGDWVDTCLVEDGSILTPQSGAWRLPNFNLLESAFIEKFDDGKDNFLSKLKNQLAGSPVEVTQLAAEIYLIHVLCNMSMGGPKKVKDANNILAWQNLPPLSPAVGEVLDLGFIRGGIAFNQHFKQVAFLILFGKNLKQRPKAERQNICRDPWGFKAFLEAVTSPPEFRDEMQKLALMHMVHPDTFEPIISTDAKRR